MFNKSYDQFQIEREISRARKERRELFKTPIGDINPAFTDAAERIDNTERRLINEIINIPTA